MRDLLCIRRLRPDRARRAISFAQSMMLRVYGVTMVSALMLTLAPTSIETRERG